VDITRNKELDRYGRVSYRVLGDGVHIGTVYEDGNGLHRAELPEGVGTSRATDQTLERATDWLAAWALPVDGDIETECREFARQYPTRQTLLALQYADEGTLPWEDVVRLYRAALALGIASVTGA
jgi:hypothetical protein